MNGKRYYPSDDEVKNIRELQRFLNYIANFSGRIPTVYPDGNYGSETREAVRKFQAQNGLSPTGETDFETILMNNETRSDLIATFAAVLELVKFQRVFLSGDEENPRLKLNMSHDIGKNEDAGNGNPEEEKY